MSDLVAQLKNLWGKDYKNASTLLERIAAEHPEQMVDVVSWLLESRASFGRKLLDLLPLTDYPTIVKVALDLWESDLQYKEPQTVLSAACEQAPTALHPHLDTFWRLWHQSGEWLVYPHSAWHESELIHFDFLSKIAADPNRNFRERLNAAVCLLTTHHPKAFEFVKSIGAAFEPNYSFDWLLLHDGYVEKDNGYRRLYSEPPLHVIFPRNYWGQENSHKHTPTRTWDLHDDLPVYEFGGMHEAVCSGCQKPLHRLIILNPIPSELGIQSVSSLTLAACLRCLGWKRETIVLYYQHDERGQPQSVPYPESQDAENQYAQPLRETPVQLANKGSRRRWDGGHRFGGYPTWLQNPEFPECKVCNEPMQHLFQFDDDLRGLNGGWMWGADTAYCHGYWCDTCRISAWYWECL